MKKIKATIEIDLDTGDYGIQYNNVSEPGKDLDFTLIMKYLRAIFSKHEPEVLKDAETGKSGQSKRDKEEMN